MSRPDLQYRSCPPRWWFSTAKSSVAQSVRGWSPTGSRSVARSGVPTVITNIGRVPCRDSVTPTARVLILGLAPGAHGSNRTGRPFTGDASGKFMYPILHKVGFASQPNADHRDDGLKLIDCYITAAVRCAPPDNKPLPIELVNCSEYLDRELAILRNVKVVVALGKIAFDAYLAHAKRTGLLSSKAGLAFGHGQSIHHVQRRYVVGVVPSLEPEYGDWASSPLPCLKACFAWLRGSLATLARNSLPGSKTCANIRRRDSSSSHAVATGMCENGSLCLSIPALENPPLPTCWSTFRD